MESVVLEVKPAGGLMQQVHKVVVERHKELAQVKAVAGDRGLASGKMDRVGLAEAEAEAAHSVVALDSAHNLDEDGHKLVLGDKGMAAEVLQLELVVFQGELLP